MSLDVGVVCAMGWRGWEGLHGDQAAWMKRKGRLARSWTHKALAEATDPANTSSPTKGRGGARLHGDYTLQSTPKAII